MPCMIDAHLHFVAAPDDVKVIQSLDVKLVNICVSHAPWRQQEAVPYQNLATIDPSHFAWVTTFDVPTADEPVARYVDRVLAGLDEDFRAGAIAVKVWKNIGMEARDDQGRYRQIDDPLFEPIFAHLEAGKRTVVMHIGEPYACWQPLSAASPHYTYYRDHPQWHMWGRPDVPSHATLIAARDHVVERHSNLRVVGAHLASLEYDLNQLAERLDRYENLAVDTSARAADLATHDPQQVREFFARFADRILWGTDFVHRKPRQSGPAGDAGRMLRLLHECEYAFYATGDTVSIHGSRATGLQLPHSIVDQLFFRNACRWLPGVCHTARSPVPHEQPTARPYGRSDALAG